MSYEDQLQSKFDLTTESGKADYQKFMTLESLDGYVKALTSAVQDRLDDDIDDEDFQDTIEAISIKITEAFALVRKYHDVLN